MDETSEAQQVAEAVSCDVDASTPPAVVPDASTVSPADVKTDASAATSPSNDTGIDLALPSKELAWAPCAYAGPLQIKTRLQLRSAGGGAIEMNEATAHVGSRVDPETSALGVELAVRPCGAAK